jgi:hypothetical protein
LGFGYCNFILSYGDLTPPPTGKQALLEKKKKDLKTGF